MEDPGTEEGPFGPEVSELGERVIRGDVAEKQSVLKLQSDISKNENKFRLVRLG